MIDPRGRVVDRAGKGISAALEAEVVPLDVATVYRRTGDLFAYFCVLAAAVGLAGAFRRRRRHPR